MAIILLRPHIGGTCAKNPAVGHDTAVYLNIAIKLFGEDSYAIVKGPQNFLPKDGQARTSMFGDRILSVIGIYRHLH